MELLFAFVDMLNEKKAPANQAKSGGRMEDQSGGALVKFPLGLKMVEDAAQ